LAFLISIVEKEELAILQERFYDLAKDGKIDKAAFLELLKVKDTLFYSVSPLA
jgi:hypothetical protein